LIDDGASPAELSARCFFLIQFSTPVQDGECPGVKDAMRASAGLSDNLKENNVGGIFLVRLLARLEIFIR